jgi:parallel beta-helix repeat protein
LGRLPAGTTVGIAVAGRGAVPIDATLVDVNVAVVGATQHGILIVHPCATYRTWEPSMTFEPETQAATLRSEIGPNGAVCFYTSVEAEIQVDRAGITAVTADAPAPPTSEAVASTPPPIATTTIAPVAPTPAPTTVAPTAAPTTTTAAKPAPTTTTPPTTTPPTTTPPAPAPVAPAPTSGAGTTVGSQAYPVPAGALIVAPNGNDAAPGTTTQPLKTVTRALEMVPAGGTVVLRAGTYSESIIVSKRVTIQAWPGEAVWFDGSRQLTNWVADGSAWRADGWTTEFDSSPTYTRGAPDNGGGWGFVDPNYPLAAYPDQMWVDGTALTQVGSRSAVVAGTFFHDEPGNRLYVGTNPSGRQVRAAALVKAFSVRADGVVLRGFGIRRYSPSVPDMGAVTLERPGARMEHVAITDVSTTAVSVISSNATVSNVYIARAGMLGLHGNHADNLVIARLLAEGNNTERFNQAPVSGGVKVTRSRVLTVKDSVVRNNRGPGLWFDESTYDLRITGNELRSNTGHGVSMEISAKAVLADNYITGNGGFGAKINDISDVKIWNNTFVGNNRAINIVQDYRRHGDGSPGIDPRYPDDPAMTWVINSVVVANNVIAAPTTGNCLLCVEDYSKQRTAAQMGVIANSNVYNRPGSSPYWLVIWSQGPANPLVFTSVSAFQSSTRQEANGVFATTAVVDANGVPTAAMPNASIARPLPADIASLISQPAGALRLGAF